MNGVDDPNEYVIGLFGERVSRRTVLKGSAAAGAALVGPLIYTGGEGFAHELERVSAKANLPYHANTAVRGTIEFWHHWQSSLRHQTIRTLIKLFNRKYPHVHVKETAFPFGEVWQRNAAAIAAGKGMPDVLVSNRPSLWYDAGKRHQYENLTARFQRDRLSGSVYWPFTWYEAAPGGKVYALPFETDCRVLFWNRAMFLDTGLNANKGPATWADSFSFARMLEHKTGGQFDILGFYPLWGNSMDLAGWVWTNRGDVQDKHLHPTLNSARMVETGQWLQKWAQRYGVATLNAITALNQPGRDQFGSGHVAMEVHIPGQQAVMNFYGVQFTRKDGSKPFPYWGVGLVPHNAGGKSYNFSGGFSLSMPVNHHRSKATSDAAWEFVKFMSLVGQRTWAQLTAAIPCVVSIARNDPILTSQPHWKNFLQAMALGHAADRNTWDVNFPSDVLTGGVNAQDKILSGADVKAALDAAQAQALETIRKNGGP